MRRRDGFPADRTLPIALALLLALALPLSAQTVVKLHHHPSGEADKPGQNLTLTLPTGEALQLDPLFVRPSDPAHEREWVAHGLDRWYRVHDDLFPAQRLAGVQGVEQACADTSYLRLADLPDDYQLHDQWGLERIGCPEAWSYYHGEGNTLVAVLDAGCNIHHEDLAANIAVNAGEDLNGDGIFEESERDGIDNDGNGYVDDGNGYDFVTMTEAMIRTIELSPVPGDDYAPPDPDVFPDYPGHGTLVSGIAAGVTDNGLGIASPGWHVRLLPIKVAFSILLHDGSVSALARSSDVANGIIYAVDRGARVISISLATENDPLEIEDAVAYARSLGVAVIAAAGNAASTVQTYPAAFEQVLAIGATQPNDHRLSYSNYGDWVNLMAPGEDIWGPLPGNQYNPELYGSASGTSLATPIVAGAAALLLNLCPDLTVDSLEQILETSADSIDSLNPGQAGLLGAGRVNIGRAVRMALEAERVPNRLTVSINPRTGAFDLSWYLGYWIAHPEQIEQFQIYLGDQPIASVEEFTYQGMFGQAGFSPFTVQVDYTNGATESSAPLLTFPMPLTGPGPENLTARLTDSQWGKVQLAWEPGEWDGELETTCLGSSYGPVNEWMPLGESRFALAVGDLHPFRLLATDVAISAKQEAMLQLELFPKEEEWFGTTPVYTQWIEVQPGETWYPTGLFRNQVVTTDSFLVSFRTTAETGVSIGVANDSTGRFAIRNQDGWYRVDQNFAIRAQLARYANWAGKNVNAPGRSDLRTLSGIDAEPGAETYCSYNIYRNGELIGQTLETGWEDRLLGWGQPVYSVEAVYSGAVLEAGESASTRWESETSAFLPVAPTGVAESFTIERLIPKDVTPSDSLELAVFDGDLCVGAGRFASGLVHTGELVGWGALGEQPGFSEGHTVHFEVVDPAYPHLEVIPLLPGTQLLFQTGVEEGFNLYLYLPHAPTPSGWIGPEADLMLDGENLEPENFRWTASADPDPEAHLVYDLRLQAFGEGLLLDTTYYGLLNTTQRVNFPVWLAGRHWADTLSVQAVLMVVSPPDTVAGDPLQLRITPNPGTPLPSDLQLSAAWPNPFNARANIRIALPEDGAVRLEVLDLLGRRVFSQTRHYPAGYHTLSIGPGDGAAWSSGMYFVVARSGARSVVRKVMLVK